MKLKYLTTPDKGIPMIDSYGNQRVCGILIDDGDFIILFVDKNTSSMYIERVINKFLPDMFASLNLAKISDEQFAAYYDFFVSSGLYDQDKKVIISKDEIIGTASRSK